MATPKKHHHVWTRGSIARLRKFARENTPTRIIALKLRRTVAAVRAKASGLRLSLKPTNQRPYGRRKR